MVLGGGINGWIDGGWVGGWMVQTCQSFYSGVNLKAKTESNNDINKIIFTVMGCVSVTGSLLAASASLRRNFCIPNFGILKA